jgi:hypothetical protein
VNIWWIVLAIFVLAVIAVVSVVLRNARQGPSVNAQPPASDRDFVQEREASRLGGMSEEDRAWQAASLEKDRTTREGTPPDQQ